MSPMVQHPIVLATTADVAAIDRLAERSVLGLHRGFYDAALLAAAVDILYGADHQLLLDGTYFVIRTGEGIAAAGGWSWRQTIFGAHDASEPAAAALDPATDAARIRGFYVDPGFAGSGLGSRLLRFCEEQARAAGFTRTALTSTEPAVRFYRRHGYREHDTFEVPMRDGLAVPLVNMDKAL